MAGLRDEFAAELAKANGDRRVALAAAMNKLGLTRDQKLELKEVLQGMVEENKVQEEETPSVEITVADLITVANMFGTEDVTRG